MSLWLEHRIPAHVVGDDLCSAVPSGYFQSFTVAVSAIQQPCVCTRDLDVAGA